MLISRFRQQVWFTYLLSIGIAAPTTYYAYISKSIPFKMVVGLTNTAILGYAARQFNIAERLQSVDHHATEYQDQQMILSSFEPAPLPKESQQSLPSIQYDSLPLQDYHVFALDVYKAISITNNLVRHLINSFDVQSFDFRSKSLTEAYQEYLKIKALLATDISLAKPGNNNISDIDNSPGTRGNITSNLIVFIFDKFPHKLYQKIRDEGMEHQIKLIVSSPSECPIDHKLLDNRALQQYAPLCLEQVGYINIKAQSILAIS